MKKLIRSWVVAAAFASSTGYSAHHEAGEQMHSDMTTASARHRRYRQCGGLIRYSGRGRSKRRGWWTR